MSAYLINLSKSEIKRIKRDRPKVLEKKHSEYKKKQKLIDDIKKNKQSNRNINTPTQTQTH